LKKISTDDLQRKLAEKIGEWMAAGKTAEQAAKIVRKHTTAALLREGFTLRSIQRLLPSLQAADGNPLFTGRIHPEKEATPEIVAMKSAKFVSKMIEEKITLSDVVKAWESAQGHIGNESVLLESLAQMGLIDKLPPKR